MRVSVSASWCALLEMEVVADKRHDGTLSKVTTLRRADDILLPMDEENSAPGAWVRAVGCRHEDKIDAVSRVGYLFISLLRCESRLPCLRRLHVNSDVFGFGAKWLVLSVGCLECCSVDV